MRILAVALVLLGLCMGAELPSASSGNASDARKAWRGLMNRVAPRIGLPVLRAVMLVWGSLVCQLRGFIDAFWLAINRVMRSPVVGPTIPGPAALVQLLLLLVLLALGYVAAGV